MDSSETLPATQARTAYGFYVTLMMEKRAGTCPAMPSESTTLALLISQYPYGKHNVLQVIAGEWFLMAPADFCTLKFHSVKFT